MKAELLPLIGKYYGTKIKITDDNGFDYIIKLWNSGSFEPSERELDGICTIEQWKNNDIIKIDGLFIGAKDVIEICDSHFESKETYELACKIIKRINHE